MVSLMVVLGAHHPLLFPHLSIAIIILLIVFVAQEVFTKR